ncbi:MAG TPA: hypothetical protein VFY65_21275 [Longimicrobium sp.]|nr:hypothetical protein [Longimicrobium sp.]
MRRTRPPALLVAALLLIAACRDDADGGPVVAGPDDLRMGIVAGRGIFSGVRPPGVDDPDSAVIQQPVTVRITATPDLLEEEGVTTATPRLVLPPVEVRWRTLEGWCQPVHAVTPVAAGADSVSNRLRRPTSAGHCHLVAEGVAAGRVFDADTATIDMGPGPPATVTMHARLVFSWRLQLNPFFAFSRVEDAYGNVDTLPAFTVAISRGAPAFFLNAENMVRATGEGTGAMELTVGTHKRTVELWAVEEMRRPWRLTWACYGGAGAGGVQVDSVHVRFDATGGRYGSVMNEGIAVTFEGNRTTTTWAAGQPPRETLLPNTTFHTLLRPRELEWSPGQVAASTGNGFVGGTLCDGPPGGGAWARTSPVRAVPF